jgi:hypothetical protein
MKGNEVPQIQLLGLVLDEATSFFKSMGTSLCPMPAISMADEFRLIFQYAFAIIDSTTRRLCNCNRILELAAALLEGPLKEKSSSLQSENLFFVPRSAVRWEEESQVVSSKLQDYKCNWGRPVSKIPFSRYKSRS